MDSARRAVLVIDFDPDGRDAAARLLDREGFAVGAAKDADEALNFARQHPPAAILLAIAMPNLAGIETLERLKLDPLTRDVPVVVHDRAELGAPRLRAASSKLLELLGRHVRPYHARVVS